MQAVVLAGGKGTRLRPLTLDTPKPLLPIRGRPMIAHLLARLPPVVDEVLLTVSYKADALRRWATTTTDPALDGRSVEIIEELEPLGTGGAVKNCTGRLDDTFLVLNGDLLSELDLDAQIEAHRTRGGVGTLALHKVDDPSRFGVVTLDAAGRITSFVEKPPRNEAPSDLVNAGAYVLEPCVLDHMVAGRPASIERDVFPKLVHDERGLWGRSFEGMWIDCGTPASYLDVHAALAAAEGDSFGAYIDSSATVADSAKLERCVVHENATIGRDVTLMDCIVGPDSEIGDGAQLRDCMVGPQARVPPRSEGEGRTFTGTGADGGA